MTNEATSTFIEITSTKGMNRRKVLRKFKNSHNTPSYKSWRWRYEIRRANPLVDSEVLGKQEIVKQLVEN